MALVVVNGEPICGDEPVKLSQNDRILVGDATFLKFNDGSVATRGASQAGAPGPDVGIVFDWQYAQDEWEAFKAAAAEEEAEEKGKAEAKAREDFMASTAAAAQKRIEDAKADMQRMVAEAEARAREAEVPLGRGAVAQPHTLVRGVPSLWDAVWCGAGAAADVMLRVRRAVVRVRRTTCSRRPWHRRRTRSCGSKSWR